MFRKISILFLIVFAGVLLANAQSKSTKIKLGKKTVIVKGAQFHQIEYNFSDSINKNFAYQFRHKKSLIISEISYEFENDKYQAVKIEIFTCPLDKIDKQNSYNIEMENEAVSGGKYWRLTLVSKGSGADNLFFQKQTITPETAETQAVNYVTINISSKIESEKWLKLFTK